MKLFAKEINGRAWGLFLHVETIREESVRGFGATYFGECYPSTGIVCNSYQTDGLDWDSEGHYRYVNTWRQFGFRFKGLGIYKAVILKLANETKKPIYIS